MANYFSNNQLDYGGGYIANAGQSIGNNISAYARQKEADKRETEQIKLRATIAKQAQEDAIQKQLDNGIISRWQAINGNKPLTTIKGPDGTERIDRAVANGLLTTMEQGRKVTESVETNEALAAAERKRKNAEWDAANPDPTGKYRGMPDEQRRLLQEQEHAVTMAAKRKQEQVEIEAAKQRAINREKQLDTFRSQLNRNPTPEELEETGDLGASGLGAMTQAKREADAAAKNALLTPAQKNAMASVQAGIKAGYIKPEDEAAAMAAYEQWGGHAQAFPTTERDSLTFNTMTAQGLKALNDKVQAVKDPDGMFGPLDFRTANVIGKFTGGQKDAREIAQQFEEVSKGRAFALGGKALTPTELQANLSQIGSPNDSDFKDRLGTYNSRVVRDIRLQRDRLAQGPYRFTPEGNAALRELDQVLAQFERPDAPAPGGAAPDFASAAQAEIERRKNGQAQPSR
jgi:hypothetical protein